MKSKGQISIFVIVGILLVGAVILFFVISGSKSIISPAGKEFDPESFINKCVKESARNKLDVMLLQGGFFNPEDYKIYDDIKVTYLCKNINFYEPCITQYPVYITQIQNELKNEMRSDVEACFISLDDELRQRNYHVNGGDFDIEVVFKTGIVEILVYRDMQLSKNDYSRGINSFSASLSNHIYDIASVANEIASQEAKYCYFEYVGFSLLYPDFDIRKDTMSDTTKIYTITHKTSRDKMNIAIRGCAIPAGF